MSNVPKNLRYTEEHEWAKDNGDGTVSVGVTDYAQDALGDITYLELPEVGTEVSAADAFGVVESVKTFSDLYAPLSGEVVEVNSELIDTPEGINEDPYGAWLVKIRVEDPAEIDDLMDATAYAAHLEESG